MTTRMEESSQPAAEEMRDWRGHMHSLPTGEPRFPRLAVWLLLAPLLLVAGTLVVILGGAALGLSLGVSPEDTGGAFYVVCGFVPNLVLGWLMVLIGRRRGYSRASCRVAFFTFTACVWIFLLWVALKFGQHLTGK